MKQCSRCKQSKLESDFYPRPTRPRSPLTSQCRECIIEVQGQRGRCLRCGDPISSRGKTNMCPGCSKCQYPMAKTLTGQGYVVLCNVDHPNADRGKIFEHTFVMSLRLGRPLLGHENVHHKNGNRADNRLDNLELWSTRQPSGQRVEDKLIWAREMLALYSHLEDPQ